MPSLAQHWPLMRCLILGRPGKGPTCISSMAPPMRSSKRSEKECLTLCGSLSTIYDTQAWNAGSQRFLFRFDEILSDHIPLLLPSQRCDRRWESDRPDQLDNERPDCENCRTGEGVHPKGSVRW